MGDSSRPKRDGIRTTYSKFNARPTDGESLETTKDLVAHTRRYSDRAAAERLGAGTLATLDRRRFSVVRPTHVDAFDLVP